jgi:hypothetical protein
MSVNDTAMPTVSVVVGTNVGASVGDGEGRLVGWRLSATDETDDVTTATVIPRLVESADSKLEASSALSAAAAISEVVSTSALCVERDTARSKSTSQVTERSARR